MNTTTTTALMDVKLMTGKQLVAEYNAGSGKKPIVKFVDRVTAEKRVKELRAKATTTEPAKESVVKPAEPKGRNVGARSEAIAKTWKDKGVAAQRAKRDGVSVDGVFYKSTLAAFKALGLPIEKHIKFRAELKAAGEKLLENGTVDKKPLKFKIVKQGELAV